MIIRVPLGRLRSSHPESDLGFDDLDEDGDEIRPPASAAGYTMVNWTLLSMMPALIA
jgi:hypothetical protein